MDYHLWKLGQLSPGSSVVAFGLVCPLLAACLWNIWAYLKSPLRRYPGPFFARWTNLWRLYYVWRGQSHLVIQKLHQDYGPVVRIGPNILDLDTPDLIKTVYDVKGSWKKTEFYHGSSFKSNGKIVYNLFSETNHEVHAREKRPISKFYSMNGVLPLEPHMNKVINYFCQRLEEMFMDGRNAGKSCNLGRWLLYYAWDLVGEVTFSKAIGYLEKGYDFDGTLTTSEKAVNYVCIVGQIPILDHLFDKNPIYRIGPPSFATITNISLNHLIDRYEDKDKQYHHSSKPDLLDRFIEAKKLHPDVVDDLQIVSYLLNNMIAGADTTAITIRAVFYHVLKDLRVWNRLKKDIVAAGFTDKVPVPFKDAHNIPYLNAVVREAMRVHPAIGMILERYVPESGLCLPDGSFLPTGVIVGMNPYIIGRNQDIWGDDADIFRPERWLRDEEHDESDEEYQERLRCMNSADLTFGAGSRICIGKNLALLEVYKVIATLVTLYRIELVHPDQEWKVVNSLFMRQEVPDFRLSRRHP